MAPFAVKGAVLGVVGGGRHLEMEKTGSAGSADEPWPDDSVRSALSRLREAADAANAGWQPQKWRVLESDGQEREIADLLALDLAAGREIVIRSDVALPERLCGVATAGDVLDVTIKSIYPMIVTVDGRTVLSESIPPVAVGPALIRVKDALEPHWSGALEVTLTSFSGQGGSWGGWLDFTFETARLRARFDQLDLAWSQLALATEFAATAEQRRVVRDAVTQVPPSPLELDEDDLRTALTEIASALESVSTATPDITVHVLGHTHLDLAWLWTWDDTMEVIKRDARSVVSMMRDYPEMTFTFSQPPAYEVLENEEPELFAEIKELIRAKRWEPATMQWVEGDTNLVSGELLERQLRLGVGYSVERLGVQPVVFHAPDTFGHSANLPQLVVDAGGKVYYHARGNPARPGDRRWPAYWWQGADGTRIFACSTESHTETLSAGSVARAAIEAAASGLPAALLIVGVGDHGGGPTRRGYDTLRRLQGSAGMPRLACSSFEAYADAIVASGVDLPTHIGESPTIFEGCYTTHVDSKQANRDNERRLGSAATIAALADIPVGDEFEVAERDACFHQFHDIIDGSSIARAYEKTAADHDRLVVTTERIVQASMSALTAGRQVGDIQVANPFSHDVAELVTIGVPGPPGVVKMIDEGQNSVVGQRLDDVVAFVARVPAFSVATYSISDASAGTDPAGELTCQPVLDALGTVNYWNVQTAYFSTTVRANCGVITSLLDKRTGSELVSFGMPKTWEYGEAVRSDLALNVFQVLDERPHQMTAWHHAEVVAELSLISGAQTELVESGPVRAVIRVTHGFRQSAIVEDIVFYADLPRIDFLVKVDWQEPGDSSVGVPNLKLAFNADIASPQAWFEAPYAAVRRNGNGQEVPAARWAAVDGGGSGMAIFNDSIHGHDVLGGRIRLTLIRTAYDPDPISDRGPFEFRIGLSPFTGDWRQARLTHAAQAFDGGLITRRTPSEDMSTQGPRAQLWRPSITTTGEVVASLRGTDLGIAMRLVETTGTPTTVAIDGLPLGVSVWDADILDRPHARIDQPGSVELRPFQVRNLLLRKG